MDTSNGLKTWSQTPCEVKCRLSMTNMNSGASLTGGENVNSSMDLQDDDKLYTFKEGDYKRLYLQDIEDMLLLLVQGKLKNLTIEERLAFKCFIANVYKKHYHQKAYGRSSIGYQKLAKEAQPHKARYV
ncbi:hypothetical protein Tco_0503771 [Tanacetum coccineum]